MGWLEKTPSTWLDFFYQRSFTGIGLGCNPFPDRHQYVRHAAPPPPQSEQTTMRKCWYIPVPNPIDISNYSPFHMVQKTDFWGGGVLFEYCEETDFFTKFWYNLFHGEITKKKLSELCEKEKSSDDIPQQEFIGRHDRVRVCMGRETTART